jgi:hypothetical protein
MMLKGANSSEVITNVKAKVAEMKAACLKVWKLSLFLTVKAGGRSYFYRFNQPD